MKAWFSTPARLAALQGECARWYGTPFMANAEAPGRGVSCQKLVAAIYKGVGVCDIVVPEVSMAHGRFSRSNLVLEFMQRPEVAVHFVAVEGPDLIEQVQTGDLLGFRIHHADHHLGIATGEDLFFHALQGSGACTGSLLDATFLRRLAHVWRPMEIE